MSHTREGTTRLDMWVKLTDETVDEFLAAFDHALDELHTVTRRLEDARDHFNNQDAVTAESCVTLHEAGVENYEALKRATFLLGTTIVLLEDPDKPIQLKAPQRQVQ